MHCRTAVAAATALGVEKMGWGGEGAGGKGRNQAVLCF